MDQDFPVEGGANGLLAIAAAFRAETAPPFPIEAIYFVERLNLDDEVTWKVVAVMSPFRAGVDADFINVLVKLRRAGKLPRIDDRVRFMAVPPEHVEASRILDYSRHLGEPPLVIRDTIWQGLTIRYVLVAEDLGRRAAAA